jgi:dihydroorotate dehydrogenase electron transfer subunit
VQVVASPELTLGRPFSVAGTPREGEFDLVVEERGPGTRAICGSRPGSTFSVVGPLGNAFTMPDEGGALIVAGGIGVAGVRLLAQELRRSSVHVRALVGARSAGLLLHHLLPARTPDDGMTIEVATDDGSEGLRGTVVDLLSHALKEEERPVRIYACGPRAMLDATARLGLERDIECEVLLEEMMACGVGACRGCVVETRDGYRCVCTDGPVFDARRLLIEETLRA